MSLAPNLAFDLTGHGIRVDDARHGR